MIEGKARIALVIIWFPIPLVLSHTHTIILLSSQQLYPTRYTYYLPLNLNACPPNQKAKNLSPPLHPPASPPYPPIHQQQHYCHHQLFIHLPQSFMLTPRMTCLTTWAAAERQSIAFLGIVGCMDNCWIRSLAHQELDQKSTRAKHCQDPTAPMHL